MHSELFRSLLADVRLKEGLHACMNCGICTAVCPAAEYYDYDPRSIVVAAQSGNIESIQTLLEGNEIWYCGQCMSCKTRCPRNNCPGLVISVLREYSQWSGAFIKSRFGRQQYLLVKSLGANILKFGYCVHPSVVTPDLHPEQGPVWEWIFKHREEAFDAIGANLDREGCGAMRKIDPLDLAEIKGVLTVGNTIDLFEKVIKYSEKAAIEFGFIKEDGSPDMKKYSLFIANGEEEMA